MLSNDFSVLHRRSIAAAAAALIALGVPATGHAQDDVQVPPTDYLDELRGCQALTENAARLACFDRSVAAMVAATETGDVQIVDREDVRQEKRRLFGFTLPKIGLFGDGEPDELLETTITSVRYFSQRKLRFTTEEGAVWEINAAPRRLAPIETGDPVIFKKAALGTYFIRIDGQMGVKGKRVE
ncbi:hypothetical protein [Erythrobacter sp. JK5]|uniref:hypothetical protein n=1 Tax=Erythrobacter sp. JK5 TaxID=2829500 RepID=UPI001BA91203|nr:hypothetical protein [Erythrobacter sp. JK5]QUL36611.1 hypothetical protein KDC96_09180 [Erythrobacter sp. JK5]